MAVGLDIKRLILMRCGATGSTGAIAEGLEPLRREIELDRETDGVDLAAGFDEAVRDKNKDVVEPEEIL
jgi:hypothetical protein